MTEDKPGVEVIPGVSFGFLEIGITADAFNAWMPMSFTAYSGNFDELQQVKHYGEYYQGKDEQYEKAGQPGLFKAIMEKSTSEGVAAFDQIVDEFNAELPGIRERRDEEAIKAFFQRAMELKTQKPEQK